MSHDRRGRGDIAISGIGLVTAAGIGVTANWQRVIAGTATAAQDAALAGLATDFSCRVPGFDGDALLGRRLAWRLDRFVQLAIVAAREAIADSGLDPAAWPGERVGVVVGNSLGGTETVERAHRTFYAGDPDDVSPLTVPMGMVNMVAGYVAMDCGARGPGLVTATACASGTTALGVARDLLLSGACDIVVAGGTESALTPATVTTLGRMGALSVRRSDPATASRPFDIDRDGFVAAEGAGMLVLERAGDARSRGARVHARIAGYAATADAHHATAPEPTGAGIERAVRLALADAALAPEDIDHVNAHGTSTPLNDVAEAGALHRVFGDRVAVTSTKGVTGHALAGAGAIEAAYTALALRDGVVPPTANLQRIDPRVEVDVVAGAARRGPLTAAVSTSMGFGGNNAALVITPA
ncbi:beta-ketoacyl-[acyl-carrier-protein] synthase family protein [Krasilnikovia sp. M28-CT-15]|uniref:beta-ketoacyl-[acyl-carrier-protein] synthase family protein n=1 Tax=Krasilnikovia sp. M28-CT-15 TaxID=3373540 RepID=UPI003875D7CA